MGGPGSGRKSEGKGWNKKAADKDMKRLVKMRIRKAPSKVEYRGFNIKAKTTGKGY